MGKILKKSAIWILVLTSLLFLNRIVFSSEDSKNFNPRFSIKLSGGLSGFTGGDINRHLKTYDRYLSEMTDYIGGETKTLHFVSDLEGEIRWDINPRFALIAGTGYIYGEEKSYFEFEGSIPFGGQFTWTQSYTISSKMKIIPLKLGMHYTLPFLSRINLFFDTGIYYYISKASLWKQHFSPEYAGFFIIYTKEEKFDLEANDIGFYGGSGIEFSIANNLALVLEVQGRYARLSLSGKKIYSVWEQPWVVEEGDLYIGERDLEDEGYGEHCPDLIVSRSRPSGDEFQNIRRAVLDLDGFSIKVGIRIKLF
ncbi:MAG: hypothetical protein ACFFC7_33795 [Candidatus Hermodarchaeota archaeon]